MVLRTLLAHLLANILVEIFSIGTNPLESDTRPVRQTCCLRSRLYTPRQQSSTFHSSHLEQIRRPKLTFRYGCDRLINSLRTEASNAAVVSGLSGADFDKPWSSCSVDLNSQAHSVVSYPPHYSSSTGCPMWGSACNFPEPSTPAIRFSSIPSSHIVNVAVSSRG